MEEQKVDNVNTDLDSYIAFQTTKAESPKATKIDVDLLHKRLGHINVDYIKKSIDIESDSKSELNVCESYKYSKFHAKPSKILSEIPPISTKFHKFSVDIAGLFRVKGLRGERYFITFSD